MGSVVLLVRVALAAVFATAGVAKLFDRDGSRRSLADFGVPAWAVPFVALLLPAAELATAVALLPAGSSRIGGVAALVLLLAFIAGIASALRRGQAPDCHCFGQVHSAPAGRGTLVRNSVLAALAVLVVAAGPGPTIGSWVSDRTAAELVAVGAVAVSLALTALVAQLWVQRRDLRRDLAAAHDKIAGIPPGLPVGTSAPSFALADLHGNTHTLDSLSAGGRPVVLVFVHPDCAPCRILLPDLGRWQPALADRLALAVVSTGSVEESRPGAEEHGIDGLLVDTESEVMRAYDVRGTPAAVVVAPDRTIASSVVSSPIAIEPLIRLTLRRGHVRAEAAAAPADPSA